MIFAKEGRKLSGSLKWPGASEEDFIRGTSGQFTILPKVMTKAVNNKGHSAPRKLRGNSKALFGRQRQGAEATGASGKDLEINQEKFIACSVVRARVIPPGCVMLPSRSKRS
jgi:PBP1b-binding outer membrane lipoprotein LpoB